MNQQVREGFVEPAGEDDQPLTKLDTEADASVERRRPPPRPETPRPMIEAKPEAKPKPKPVATTEPEPPAPPPEPEVAETWPVKVKLLHKPTRNAKNELVHELSFREPTAGDINRCGNPVRFNQDGDVLIEERKMSMMMSALAGIHYPFIEALDPRDWNSAAYRLRGFFIPNPAEAWVAS